ncbi:MAG TPA: CPBP family intramembrane glutamic endopeptidase [Haliangiales bacterium]|nr:CPBP family intramembrane glutamic endopeptidase [Haliangiales bacterium]
MDLPPPEAPERCAACGAALRPGAVFCGACGHRAGEPPPPPRPAARPAWPDIRSALVFYFVLLGVQVATMIMAAVGVEEFTLMWVGDALLAAAVLVGALAIRRDLGGLYGRAGFGPLGYAAIVALSYPVFVLVAMFVHTLSTAFHIHEHTSVLERGLAWSVLFVCVSPPIVEELAFRGVIFGLLRRHLAGWEALLLSAFAFAILHLSVPTLVTHLPLGLYFGWLRARGGSLWPGMLAHALHNGWVVAQDAVGVMPPFGW